MDMFLIGEEQIHKKGRHRKKHLFNSIMQQMEFYFSDSNLSKDKFLKPMIENDPYIDVSIFLNFNKIRKLTTNIDDVVKAVNNSLLLELSDDKSKVKRKTVFNFEKDVSSCTIYVERINVDATHEWLSSIFSEFGNVTYVSIPKYKQNKMNKGFAFVEFEKESEAAEALSYFENIGCRMSSLMSPESLCSIITYDGGNADVTCTKNGEVHCDKTDNVNKKRKHSMDESENEKKKLKGNISPNSGKNNNIDDIHDGNFEDKKRKKHRKMKKKVFKELGLQVLSKGEWKKIRNRYLDNQKVKMKQLKQFLNKRKLSNHMEINKQKVHQLDENVDKKNECTEMEEHSNTLPYVPGVIVKVQLSESLGEPKKVKEELKQYSTGLQYVDIPQIGGSEVYLRFSDAESAKHFSKSVYKGRRCFILHGDEEAQYWHKINKDRSTKVKKNQKRVRGREKLLKKAEKELGKHIKFDDTD